MKEKSSLEFQWIREWEEQWRALIQPQMTGIGDDCAVLPYRDHLSLLVTTDLLIENVHFIRDQISAEDLGWKSLAVNLSDIAAMGARPWAVFMGWALPQTIDPAWMRAFWKGFYTLAKTYDLPLLGGDTTRSLGPISIHVTVLGLAENKAIKYRHGAQVGDWICVTRTLGDAAAGLEILLNHIDPKPYAPLLKRHFRPMPDLSWAEKWADDPEIHALMDLSDGLRSDLPHLLERSQVGAVLQIQDLPQSQTLKSFCQKYGKNPLKLSLTGGEDYGLLVTMTPEAYHRWKSVGPLYKIGEITDDPSLKIYLGHQRFEEDWGLGFEHFKKI